MPKKGGKGDMLGGGCCALTSAGKCHDCRARHYWQNVDIKGPDECWPWKISVNKDGYGKSKWRGQTIGAARVAFFLTYGCWPEPCCLHTCDNPPCCNPAHLYEGTNVDNVRDRVERGRSGGNTSPRTTAQMAAVSVSRSGWSHSKGAKQKIAIGQKNAWERRRGDV